MQTTMLRILMLALAGLWLSACSGSEEVPKAKSASAGDALSADGGTSGDDSTAQATVEKDDGTSAEASTANEDDGKSGTDSDDDDDDDDGNDGNDGADDDDSGSKGSALTFKSSNRDDNDYSLAIKVGKSDWKRKEWPAAGESIEFPGVCKGSKVTIEVKIIHEEGMEFTKGTQLKVEASGKTATVAFEESPEDDGDMSDETSPDDLVGELSCSSAKISVK